jgi:pilus assembly protein Flp/PilA
MRTIFTIERIKRFAADETAATSIEYAVIAAGVAGAIIVAVGTVGDKVLAMWTAVKDALS